MIEDRIEIAARRYCELRGQDPDEEVSHGADPNADGFVYAVVCYSPRWTRVARHMTDHDLMTKALTYADELGVRK